MIRSENIFIDACASVFFSERITHATVVLYEFSHRQPKCLEGVGARGLEWTFPLRN